MAAQKEIGVGAPGGPAVAPVAGEPARSEPVALPAARGAVESVPVFGGNRGGRKRADGLPPGSAEAARADRQKERERKRRERQEAAQLVEPPPLPSAVAGSAGVVAPATGVEAAGEFATPGSLAPAPVPWQPELIQEFSDQLIDAVETFGVEKFDRAAREAKLPASLVKEIRAAAEYPKVAKLGLKRAVPRIVAKWLNRFHISAEHADELLAAASLTTIVLHQRRTWAKLDELIAAAKTKQPDKKDPATIAA